MNPHTGEILGWRRADVNPKAFANSTTTGPPQSPVQDLYEPARRQGRDGMAAIDEKVMPMTR